MPLTLKRCTFVGALAATLLPSAASGAATLDEARELHASGRLDLAATAYGAVLEDGELDGPSRAIASNNLCVVLDALGELAAAETACRSALELRRALGDRLRLARTLNNLGLVLQHLGSYGEAEELFSEALEINRDLGQPYAEAVNLANLGAVATLEGRFQEALERLQAVSQLARSHESEPWSAEQLRIARLNRGVVLERLGAYREALEVYSDLLGERSELRPAQAAAILMNSGVIYRNLGDPVGAIERFEAAARAYREVGDPSGLAHTELNIGIVRHLNLGEAAGAEAAYRHAIELVELSGDRAVMIEALAFLGRLLLSVDRAEEARARFDSGLALARESGSAEGVWVSLAGLGETERSLGDLDAALRHFESAIALIEEGREEVVRPDHRASFFADKRAVYSGALETLVEMDRRKGGGFAERAFEIVQQAKARDLLDSLRVRNASLEPQGTSMKPLAAGEAVRRLGKDILIEYFVADNELLLVWIEAGSVRVRSLGDPRPILEAVETAHRALSNGAGPPAALIDKLSSLLLGSVGVVPTRGRSLWIAPDRLLRYLPFELLTLPGAPSEPLVMRAKVVYLPSAWALPDAARRTTTRRPEIGFLGFGGVEVESDSAYAPWVARFALEPLPSARRELESVARRIPGARQVLTGPDATERAFRAQARRVTGVIHFATHTALAEGRDQGTAILLTPEGRDDGMLQPAEVVSTPVDAALVVLAACTTALGGREDGRALTTLTGSFLAAGSQAVLATLWPVGDQPTAVFMEQFYYQLARGLTPAEALRRTKLRFMAEERWQNPALWSGYVLTGSASAVASRRLPWTWLGAVALLLALVVIAARFRA